MSEFIDRSESIDRHEFIGAIAEEAAAVVSAIYPGLRIEDREDLRRRAAEGAFRGLRRAEME